MARIFHKNICKGCHRYFIPEYCKQCEWKDYDHCVSCHKAIYDHRHDNMWRKGLRGKSFHV